MNITIERMTEAAFDFLASLSEEQRRVLSYDLINNEEHRIWYYTPNHRLGLSLDGLMPDQQRLAHRLIASGLSQSGYVTTATIMGLENILDHRENWSSRREDMGVDYLQRVRDPNRYYLTIFGDIGSDAWAWRFGGHHVALHFTLVAGKVVSPTPTFFGANPADSPLGAESFLRPLAAEEDLARELLHLFPEERQKLAILTPVAPGDITQSNRPAVIDGALPLPLSEMMGVPFDAVSLERRSKDSTATVDTLESVRYTIAPKGLAISDMNEVERNVLFDLIRLYINRMPDDIAQIELTKLSDYFDGLFFAWAGGLEKNQGHYYRIQCDRFLIEYDNTQNDANHIHSVWRNPLDDFGGDILRQHYEALH